MESNINSPLKNLGNLGNANWKPKSILEMFFATIFSSMISASIWDRILEARHLKNGNFLFEKHNDVSKNDVFEKVTKQSRFQKQKRRKTQKIFVLTRMYFFEFVF